MLHKFNNTLRYLDDTFAVIILTSKTVQDIYPTELKLTKSNNNSIHTPFLDLDIKLENNKLQTKIYDKGNDFDFPVVYFPFLDGDISYCLLPIPRW